MTPSALVCFKPRPAAASRLVAFPFAGADAAAYHAWAGLLPGCIELHAVRLPGRGPRLRDPLLPSVDAIVAALAPEIAPLLDVPCAFFGHSLGGLLAYETARALRRGGWPLPARLFVSACAAPHLPRPTRPIHHLREPDFIAEVAAIGGTPPEVLNHAELLALLLPMLRADFTAWETYAYQPEAPLPMPFTVLGGEEDPRARRPTLEAWQAHTAGGFELHILPGGHFYLRDTPSRVLDLIAARLPGPAAPAEAPRA